MKTFARITGIVLIVVGLLIIIGGFISAIVLMASRGFMMRGLPNMPYGQMMRGVSIYPGLFAGLGSFILGLIVTALGQGLYLLVMLVEGRGTIKPAVLSAPLQAAREEPANIPPSQTV